MIILQCLMQGDCYPDRLKIPDFSLVLLVTAPQLVAYVHEWTQVL